LTPSHVFSIIFPQGKKRLASRLESKAMRTVEQVKAEWRHRGITLAAWARKHGHKPQDVRDVLRKRTKGNFGAAYSIAVELELRDGERSNATEQASGKP
jgi:gp16 family phage-associated protein